MKKANLVKYTDLLHFAETIGIGWNLANEILTQDQIPPMHGQKHKDYSIEEFAEDGENELGLEYLPETRRIMTGFMQSEAVYSITVI